MQEKKIFKFSLSVGLIHRFFVIVLLAITIVWIPTIEMVSSETLFEFMQVLKSCLTPSVTAVFLLAVFCKRVNEKVGTPMEWCEGDVFTLWMSS